MTLQIVVDDREIDASLAGICGAYCGACPVHEAWAAQDRPRLEALAKSYGTAPDRLLCTGCRTPGSLCFGGDCEIKRCAQGRGVVSCTDCDEYPCEHIRRFDAGAPYRAALQTDGERRHEIGVSAWLKEQNAKWRCPDCGAKVAAGTARCSGCGRSL